MEAITKCIMIESSQACHRQDHRRTGGTTILNGWPRKFLFGFRVKKFVHHMITFKINSDVICHLINLKYEFKIANCASLMNKG